MIAGAVFEVGEMRSRGDARVGLGPIYGAGLQAPTRGSKCETRATNNAIYSCFFLGRCASCLAPCLASGWPNISWARPFPPSPPLVPATLATTMPPSDPAMPSENADLATAWAYLEEGVDHIMREGGSIGSIPSGYL